MIVEFKKQFLLLILMAGLVTRTIAMDSKPSADGSSLLDWKTGAVVVAAAAGVGYVYLHRSSPEGEIHFPAHLRETTQPKAIIWDVGGVLVNEDMYKIATQELGFCNLLGYMAFSRKNPFKLYQRANELLNKLGEQTGPEEHKLQGPGGNFFMPQLYVDVQTGAVTLQDALKRATDLVEQEYNAGKLSGSCEKEALLGVMKIIFDSETLVKNLKINQDADNLVAACAKDPSCKQYVLQNWSAASFGDLYTSAEGQKVFKCIPRENCMISGEEGIIRPNPEIYKRLIEKFNLVPEHAVVIDDLLANVEVAQKQGFNTIHFSNMSMLRLREILIKQGYLKPGQ